jgi:hypothetical protein
VNIYALEHKINITIIWNIISEKDIDTAILEIKVME